MNTICRQILSGDLKKGAAVEGRLGKLAIPRLIERYFDMEYGCSDILDFKRHWMEELNDVNF